MAKQPKTETNTPKVPEPELVGDHAQVNAANGGKNAGADSGAASVTATATGEATAPVATSSTDTPPRATAGGAGDTASAAEGGISSATLGALRSEVLGVEQPEEKREFVLEYGPVRHNNVHYKSGAHMILTRTEHEQVCADRQRVVEWEKGKALD